MTSNIADFQPDTATWAFFFDLDGTLAPLAERPDLVKVSNNMITLLTRLQHATGGALAVISGRPLDTLDALLHPLVLPLGAEHGALVRDAGGQLHAHEGASAAVEALSVWLRQQFGESEGILLEQKSFGVAVHYRLAPQRQTMVQNLMAAAIHQFPQFELLPGKMVVEAKLPAVDKGKALLRLMQEACFSGRKPLMIGDDTTDEPAFCQANHMKGGSVKIGPGHSRAAWRLEKQADLENWLERLVGHASQGG